MKLAAIVLLCSLLAFAAASSCKEYFNGPNKEPCDCIPLPECSTVNGKMQELHKLNKRRIHYKFTRHVKKLHCWFEGKTPIICCPDSLPKTDEDLILGEWVKPYQQKYKPKQCTEATAAVTESPAVVHEREKKEKELLAACGKDLNRGEFFGNRTDLTDFPWLALLKYETSSENKLLCGGVLISDQYVLTAAHCVTSPSNKLISVRLGEYDTTTDKDCLDDGAGSEYCNDPVTDIEVESIVVHENYTGVIHREGATDDQCDLALVKLKTKVKFDNDMMPICLPRSADKEKQLYTVSGWSRSMVPKNEGLPQKLVSKVSRLAPAECEAHPVTSLYSSEDHICAGKDATQRACIADAGGPLMAYEKKEDETVRMTVFGVGFMDLTCDREGLPGVFTKVHKYMPWINKRIYE